MVVNRGIEFKIKQVRLFGRLRRHHVTAKKQSKSSFRHPFLFDRF